jgi:hypothetical protein
MGTMLETMPIDDAGLNLALHDAAFAPTAHDIATYGQYELRNARLLDIPADVRDDEIAYNPSGIWTVRGSAHSRTPITLDIMYNRVEPNRSCATSSHLGRSVVRPYIVDLSGRGLPFRPFDDAPEIRGEDPALTRITRRLSSGVLERVWLLSVVDAHPKPDKPDEVLSLETIFYVGKKLKDLEPVAKGPPGEKDLRPSGSKNPEEIKIDVYGRPQPKASSGNITHTTVPGIGKLNENRIYNAPFIDKKLLPVGSGLWGGVNDAIDGILVAHRAWRTGPDGHGRHYESVLYGHDRVRKTIVTLGVIATADMFPACEPKADDNVDLRDVVFIGGGHNGKLDLVTFGLRDARIGIADIVRVR